MTIKSILRGVRYASTKTEAVKLPHRAPQNFQQTVVLTNGATFKLRTTSPKGILILTKDTRNHRLWNPHLTTEADLDSNTLAKFSKKFSGLEDFGLEEDGDSIFETMTEASEKLEVTSKDLSFLSTKKSGKK
ncbi:hypothetical protein K502DRAFT_322512 [Neoconidiobolus thromboides FSU 785]|nr:hypothetical protein K502DRAFT_322512 [Neoconidiobolus thromboides FSU 785]